MRVRAVGRTGLRPCAQRQPPGRDRPPPAAENAQRRPGLRGGGPKEGEDNNQSSHNQLMWYRCTGSHGTSVPTRAVHLSIAFSSRSPYTFYISTTRSRSMARNNLTWIKGDITGDIYFDHRSPGRQRSPVSAPDPDDQGVTGAAEGVHARRDVCIPLLKKFVVLRFVLARITIDKEVLCRQKPEGINYRSW